MAIHSSILAGESHGQQGLIGYSRKGHKESDMTEQLSMQANNQEKVTVSVRIGFSYI